MTRNKDRLWVIIPAAGSGQRMLRSTPKQYLIVHGKTIMEYTLQRFLERQDVQKIVVCTSSDDQIWQNLKCASDEKIVRHDGGQSRAQSVLNGLQALNDKAHDNDWVLVHDAARPCLSEESLDRLIKELGNHDVGGILAIPAKDTLKQAQDHCAIDRTLDRATIWQAQTPQMFRYGLLKTSLSKAIEQEVEITDESSALEWAGYSPCLIEGDARNLKVTTPEDLILIDALLA